MEAKCRSLRAVGGLYELLAIIVWEQNIEYVED